jgi:hypothetical protein
VRLLFVILGKCIASGQIEREHAELAAHIIDKRQESEKTP